MPLFGGFGSALLTQGANALGSYGQGQMQGQNLAIQRAIQALTMQRQQRMDDLQRQVDQAGISEKNAQSQYALAHAGMLNNPKFTYKMGSDGQWYAFPISGDLSRVGSDAGNSGPGKTPDDSYTSDGATYSDEGSIPTIGASTTPPARTSPFGVATGVGAPLKTPTTPLANQMHSRIATLTSSGVPLDKAREQARSEYGQAAPQQSFSFPQGVDPATGQPVILKGNTKTGDLTETPFGPKPSGGGGGQSLSPDDRAKMLAQAKLDNATMKAYEDKVMVTGKVPGFVAGAAGIAASAAPSGVLGGLTGLVGNAATGAVDPDYQRYITAQRSYSRAMANLQSKRYTDHQQEIERSISGLQGNDLNETIKYKQALRDASLNDPTVRTDPQGGGRGGGGQPTPNFAGAPQSTTTGNINLGGGTASITPAERAQLKALGYTDAQINAYRP